MCGGDKCKGGSKHKCSTCKINEAKKMLPMIAKKKIPVYMLAMRRPGINVLGKFAK